MRHWQRHLRVGDVFHDDALSVEEKAETIGKRFKTLFPGDSDVAEFADELYDAAKSDGVEGFDEVWESIYDWADRNDLWIETTR